MRAYLTAIFTKESMQEFSGRKKGVRRDALLSGD
jgi:hypothetical protein